VNGLGSSPLSFNSFFLKKKKPLKLIFNPQKVLVLILPARGLPLPPLLIFVVFGIFFVPLITILIVFGFSELFT
jgi:hypothetical protein